MTVFDLLNTMGNLNQTPSTTQSLTHLSLFTAPFRGRNGPIGVTNVKWQTEIADAFIKAGKELGYPSPVNANGYEQYGKLADSAYLFTISLQ